MRTRLAWTGAVIVLLVLNGLVLRQEQLLKEGRTVILRLAPVDPRSLVQGDFMRLRYDLDSATPPAAAGRLVVKLDSRGVGTLARFSDDGPLAPDECAIRYRVNGTRLEVAPDSYFFQEGRAEHFSTARYAKLHVSPDGTASLTGLLDESLHEL